MLSYAVKGHGSPELVRFLLFAGCDLHARDHESRTALHVAVARPSDQTVTLVSPLTEAKADVNATDVKGRTSLCVTTESLKGSGETGEAVVRILLQPKADPNIGNLVSWGTSA